MVRSEHRHDARQVWSYYSDILQPARMAILLSLGAIPGMIIGTALLASARQDVSAIESGAVHRLLSCFADWSIRSFSISARTADRDSGFRRAFLGGIMPRVSSERQHPSPCSSSTSSGLGDRCSSARFRRFFLANSDRFRRPPSGGRVC